MYSYRHKNRDYSKYRQKDYLNDNQIRYEEKRKELLRKEIEKEGQMRVEKIEKRKKENSFRNIYKIYD